MLEIRPIVIDENNIVLGGNMRLRAVKELGYKEVPVVLASDLTDEQKKEFIIKDNLPFGDWDWDILANEWDSTTLSDWGMDLPADFIKEPEERDAEPQIDKAEELNKKWKVKTGDLWTIGEHRLLCGDATKKNDVNRLMVKDKADCIFTSPPYGVGVDYGKTYQDTIDNLRDMIPVLSALWMDITVDGGFAVINFGDIVSGSKIVGTKIPCEYPMALEYWPAFRSAGWVLWSRRIWCKNGSGTGSMQCISSNRASTNWEHIWTWKKTGPNMFPKQTTGKYPSQSGWIDSSHEGPLEIGLKDHGAGMPLLPALFSISNHSTINGYVHEPFTGTGTTMVACQNLGRKCRGIEISPAYCAVILERMQTAFPELEIKRER